jgi:MoxR-like ATPase
MELAQVQEHATRILDEVERAVVGKREALELVLMGLLADGHVLLEDYPGLAKTLAARSFAAVTSIGFNRIQFTPDLMPSDVTGSSIWNQRDSDFLFRPGPIFTNLLLADEINRAPPKTQAALLEAMQERQVTIEGVTHPLARPFLVLATQNPIEYEGTYPLPEAQLDRFTMRIAIGYPPLSEEAKMLTEQTADPPLEALVPVANAADAISLAEEAKAIFVEESLNRYVVALLRATRADSRLYLGASPRAGIALLRVAKARALADARGYLQPDDVKAVAVPVLSHRLILAPEARSSGLTGEQIIQETLEKTPVPI